MSTVQKSIKRLKELVPSPTIVVGKGAQEGNRRLERERNTCSRIWLDQGNGHAARSCCVVDSNKEAIAVKEAGTGHPWSPW